MATDQPNILLIMADDVGWSAPTNKDHRHATLKAAAQRGD